MKKNQWLIPVLVFIVIILLWTIGIIPKGVARLAGTIYVKQYFPEMELKCTGVEYADVFGDYLIAFEAKNGNRYSCVIRPKILPISLGQGLSEIESDYEEYCKDKLIYGDTYSFTNNSEYSINGEGEDLDNAN